MNHWIRATLIAVFVGINIFHGSAIELSAGGANVCATQVQKTREYYVQVIYEATEYYSACCGFTWPVCWNSCQKSRPVRRTRREVRTRYEYITVQECCAGYSQVGNQCPRPVCANGCLFGSCVAPDTCSCDAGYTGSTCATNIDECATNNGGCQQSCVDTHGSYICGCYQGYTRHQTDKTQCDDVNECDVDSDLCKCADKGNNPLCTATCVNKIGSYMCSCTQGYESKDNQYCRNTIECNANNGNCSDFCYDTFGSYYCGCPNGYQLGVDKRTCEDNNECLSSNGGCDHVCDNTLGSRQCSCKPGYLLDANGKTCSDRDECKTTNHGCEYCGNLRGSYECTCPHGYVLNSDNKTCSDINECEPNSPGETVTLSGCDQDCVNTNGSFYCRCNKGYSLAVDNKTCINIDECALQIDECEQVCIDVLSTYVCACKVGYTLNVDDRKSCVGNPCEDLPQFANGKASCLKGVTGTMCSFQCNPGFERAGSSRRWCQPNHKWNGTNAICKRKSCPIWQPPVNGASILPCNHFFESECKIKCIEGYHLNGSDIGTCNAEADSDMQWTDTDATCEKSTICSPNPCFHSGICTPEDDKATCDCTKTGYKGVLCRTGIVTVPQLPILSLNIRTTGLQLSAKPDEELYIQLISISGNLTISPRNLTLTNSTTTASFSLIADAVGFFTIKFKLTGKNALEFVTPSPATVYVGGGDAGVIVSSPIDADGSIKAGCYMQNNIEGQTGVSNLKWNNDGSSKGIVQLSDNNGKLLPLSLSGGELKPDSFTPFPINNGVKAVGTDAPKSDKNCYSENDASKYIGELLDSNAFAYSIQNAFNNHSPYWIKFVAALHVQEYKSSDLGGGLFKGSELVNKRTPCTTGLPLNPHTVYYHYQTKQVFYAMFTNKNVTLPMTVTKCFVKDLTVDTVFVSIIPDTTNESSMDLFSNAFSKISNFNGMIDRVGFNLNTSSGDVMYSFGNRIMNLGNGEVDANISANGIMTWISKDISNIFTTSEMKSYTVRDGTVDFTLKWNVFNSTQSMQVKGDITQMRLMNENSSISPCNNGTINIQVSTKHTTFLTARIDNIFTFSKRHGIDALINHDVIGGDRSISSSDWQKITQKLRDYSVLQDTLSFLKGFSSINVEITISVNELIPIVEALINNAKSLSRTTTLLTMKDKAERITEIKTSLIDSTKRFQILLKRYLKIDFFDDADMERRHNTFKTYADDLIKQLEYEIDNSMTSRINWFKVSGVGDICVQTYCFKDLNVSLIYGSILANSKCYTGQQHNSNAKNTLLKGIVVNGTNVGGLIKLLPKTVVETNLLSSSNTITASFKGQLTVYNQSKLSDVDITNSSMSLNFDVAFMRQDRVQMNVTTSLASVALDDPIYFKFKSRFDSPSSLASDINKQVISILNDIEKNIDNRVSLILSYQNRTTRIALERVIEYMNMTNRLTNLGAQLASLMTNISYAEKDYEAKKKALNSSFATHALTTEQLQMKSKLLNDCRPKLCLPQCLPGITINVCQSEKTVFKMVRNCSFVLKSRNVLDVVQVNTTKSYIALDPKKICNTECPPLTGFFKKIFGKRKKRGLVNVVAVPALTSLFKKVGGTEGEIGAIVGGAVLGPLGAVVGGTIGSIFGSCDEVCRYVFLPKTVNYQVISIDRKLRTVEDLESVCKNSPTNTSIGFKEAEACPRFDNCSNLSVDKQCLKRNIECKLIKGNLSSILSNPSYDASYNEYITASALLDLLSTKQSILTKRVQNMQKEVEISKAASILANQSMELANMAKQEFYDLTVRERKLISKYKSIRDNDTVLDVEDVTFYFVHVDAMKFPKRFVLNIKYKNLVSSATQFSTMFNAPEYFSSVEDAARKLIDVVVESISGSSRKRRALTLPAMTQLEQKCISLENAALELYDIANSLDLEIKKYEKAHEDYTREVINDETEARTYLERLTTSVANAYDCNEIHCDDGVKQVVGDISRELSNEKTETTMLTWNETLQRFFTNFELKIKARENSECVSFLDCVTYHLDQLHKLVQYSDMKLAKKVKQHIPIWNSTILTLFNDNPSLEVAKKLTLEFLMSFHEVNPKDIFCGEAPKLETRLSGERHEMENTFLSLSIEIGETIHAYEIIWKRNNFVINSQYGKTMKVLMTDTKPAYYSCEVSNMFGKTHCGEVLVKVYAEPEIVNHPEDTTIHEYSPINKFIYCNVTGSQDLSIRWYYRSFMGNQSELLQNTGNALQIGVNSVAKSGYYHCLVQNRLYSIQSKIAVVNILPITMAVERTKLAFTLNLNKKSARNKRSVSANASVEMPSKINNDEMLNISAVVANAMNTTVSNIRELIYTKTAGDSVEVTFTLYGTNFTGELNKLSPTSSWDALSEQLMKDRENLILRSILLYYHANETMSFMIGGYNATVDPDSITSEGMEVSCQQGQIVLQNGFVCGDCPAGTRFDGVGKCIDCTKDMYQYLSGQLVCHQCPQHTETTSAKSVSIFDCKDITSTTATTKSTSTLTQRITPIEVDDEEDDKLKIIIPILTVVVILFIAGIIFCCVRNRQKKSADIKDPDATERHTNPTFEIGRFSSIESENAIENPYATCSDTGAVQMSNVNDYGVPSKIKQEKTNKRLSAIPNPYEFDDGEEVTKGAHTFENPTYRQNTLRSNSVDYDNLDRVRNVNNKQTRNTGHYEHAFVPIKKKTGESVSNEAFHDSD